MTIVLFEVNASPFVSSRELHFAGLCFKLGTAFIFKRTRWIISFAPLTCVSHSGFFE